MEKPTGVKYFQLETGYSGDTIGENRSLRGVDIDNNFYFLRGYDIESIEKQEDNSLVLKRVNGELIPLSALTDFNFTLDSKNGNLVIDLPNGEQKIIEGFATLQTGTRVATDATLDGFGTIDRPLRIAGAERTGTLAPVDEFWDITSGDTVTLTEETAKANGFSKGYRIVTKENASDFGFLYNWSEIAVIKNNLNSASSAWRVPTKADWDSLLNYVENDIEYGDYDCDNPNPHPCGDEGEHSSRELNVKLGEYAGKYLKGDKLWTSGIDKYGFSIVPVGYIPDDGGDDDCVGQTAVFWCDEQADSHNEMYVKRFEADLDKVKQEGFGPNYRVSLRLVKDANGSNCNNSEYIDALGFSVPTVYINDKIWTTWNIGYGDGVQFGKRPDVWEGLDVETKEVLMVNEWDGEKWTKRQLIDGDSIIIRHYVDPDDPTHTLEYHEFRAVKKDGKLELTDLIEILEAEIAEDIDNIRRVANEAKDIAEQTQEDLAEEVSARTQTDTNLANEIDRATNRENEIASDLSDLSDRVTSEVERLDLRCDENAERLVNAVSALTDTINELDAKVDQEVATLDTKIDQEVTTLDNKIDTVSAQLDAKIDQNVATLDARIDQEVATLDTKIDDEAARLDAKIDQESTTLNTKIDTEVAALQNALSEEVSARTQSEATLDAKIDDNVFELQAQITANMVEVRKHNVPTNPNNHSEYALYYTNSNIPVNDVVIEIPNDRFVLAAELLDTNATWVDTPSKRGLQPGNPEGEPALVFAILTTDGSVDVVAVPLTNYLASKEFKDGLVFDEDTHVVKVKIADILDEGFLRVNQYGIYTEGIGEAISSAETAMLSALDASETGLRNQITALTASVQNQITTLNGNIQNQITALTSQVQVLQARVAALEDILDDLLDSEEFKAAVTKQVVHLLTGKENQIAITKKTDTGQEAHDSSEVDEIEIGFASNAMFIADM